MLIFADLTRALTDSTQSEIWPSNRSQVVGPSVPNVGERVRVTYKLNILRRTYGYILSEFTPGRSRVFVLITQRLLSFRRLSQISSDLAEDSKSANCTSPYHLRD
jgi:hypothetical protein